MEKPRKVYTSFAANAERLDTFINLVTALHYDVMATCPACGELAPVVPFEKPRSYCGYQCKCGASWVKRTKYQHQHLVPR